jgi:hypothetical protein
MDAIALGLSISAFVVSLGAAAFTGWQAITAHLERTRPKPAALSLVDASPYWEVENSGGSLATGVRLTFTYELDPRRGETAEARVRGDIPAGQRRRVDDSTEDGKHFIVTGTFVKRANGSLRRANSGEIGDRILARQVRISWIDYQGKTRKSTILIP